MVIDWWLAGIRWKVGVSAYRVFLGSRATGIEYSYFDSLVEQLSDLAGPAGRGTDAGLECRHCTTQMPGDIGKVNYVCRVVI
jgi:hypothetical protein